MTLVSINKKTVIKEALAKLQFLQEQPIKKAVLQAVGRKTARATAKLTEFCKKL